MADEHRLLTVAEPWATPIVDGLKPTENRGTGFNKRFRGLLWIHTAQRWSDRGAMHPEIIARYGTRRAPAWPLQPPTSDDDGFLLGFVIGHVTVVDIHSEHGCGCSWGETQYENSTGQLVRPVTHLVLERPHRLSEPIPHSDGRLGIWAAKPGRDDELIAELDAALEART